MAGVLRSVRPIVDKAVSRFPKYNAAVLGGEARRLTIAAVKSFDPAQGTKLPSHIYNHLKPMGRFASTLGSVSNKSRLDRERTAEYLKGIRDLTEINNREPLDEELRDYLRVDQKTLSKMRQASTAEVAEGQMEFLPDQQDEDPRMALWTEYVYRDLDPRGKLIMDYKLGRNGKPMLGTEELALKLNLNPDYVNRKAGEIAKRILDGAGSSQPQVQE
jgi:hypothetical protein